METINNELMTWLQQMGVVGESAQWVVRIIVILAILLIVFVFDKICRKVIIPTVQKVTAKTQVTWDDYILNEKVLDNVCHLRSRICWSSCCKSATFTSRLLS